MGIFDTVKDLAIGALKQEIGGGQGINLQSIQSLAEWAGQNAGLDTGKILGIVQNILSQNKGNFDIATIAKSLFSELQTAGASNLSLQQVTQKVTELLSSQKAA